MMQLIFFFPVIYFTVKPNPKKGLICWFTFNAFYEVVKYAYGVGDEAYRLGICRYAFLIALGSYMFLSKEPPRKRNWIVLCLIGAAYIIFTGYLGYETKIINNSWKGTSFIAALYIAPIFYAIIQKCRNFNNKILAFLGKASFNIFLTQMVYYAYAANYIYSISDNIVVRLILNVVLCSMAGIVFYVVESKFTVWVISVMIPYVIKLQKLAEN